MVSPVNFICWQMKILHKPYMQVAFTSNVKAKSNTLRKAMTVLAEYNYATQLTMLGKKHKSKQYPYKTS